MRSSDGRIGGPDPQKTSNALEETAAVAPEPKYPRQVPWPAQTIRGT